MREKLNSITRLTSSHWTHKGDGLVFFSLRGRPRGRNVLPSPNLRATSSCQFDWPKAAADSGTLVCLPPAHHPVDFSTVPTTDPLHPPASDRQDAFFAHSTKAILARYSTIRREPDSVGRNAKRHQVFIALNRETFKPTLPYMAAATVMLMITAHVARQ